MRIEPCTSFGLPDETVFSGIDLADLVLAVVVTLDLADGVFMAAEGLLDFTTSGFSFFKAAGFLLDFLATIRPAPLPLALPI